METFFNLLVWVLIFAVILYVVRYVLILLAWDANLVKAIIAIIALVCLLSLLFGHSHFPQFIHWK